MEAKKVFDLVTHIFLLFPFAIIWKFTKPFGKEKKNKDSILLFITVLLFFVSMLHHILSHLPVLEAIDESVVGLSIVYVFYIYLDEVLNTSKPTKYIWYAVLFIILVSYLVCVGIDVTNELYNNENLYLTVFCTGGFTFIAVCVFIWKGIYKKHETSKNYFWTSVFFAILASVMFIINDVAEQFHLHSLWHLFAFISFGYLVLFAVSPKIENKEKAKKTIMAMNYVLSLSVRLLLIGYYGYVASLNEIPVGWSIFAFVWGGVIFVYGLIWAFRNFQNSDNFWLGMRLILHGGIWILVGAFLNLKYSELVIVFLVLDFIISIIFRREKIMEYWDTLKTPIPSSVELTQKYKPVAFKKRYPVLQF